MPKRMRETKRMNMVRITNNKWETAQDARDETIRTLDMLNHLYPDTKITIEIPHNTVSCRIGNALIYEDGHGSIIIDAE